MAANTNTSTLLGSDSWIGADPTQPGNEFHQRASTFLSTVKWDALLSLSSRVRDEIPCKVSDSFSIIQSNLIRRIIFDDQVSWTARFRMPLISAIPSDREAASAASILEVEAASMKFLGAKTSIPVPAVHIYDTTQDNEIGAPYILMDYIHGIVASEMRLAKGSSLGLYGTPDQDHSFRREMATIQAALATFKFDRIGSLYQDPATQEFFIGGRKTMDEERLIASSMNSVAEFLHEERSKMCDKTSRMPRRSSQCSTTARYRSRN